MPPFPQRAEPEIIALRLVDGENGDICLVGYHAYTFNISINDTDGAGDIKFVNVTLEPGDENITLCWRRDNGANFNELPGGDPDDHVSLTSGNDDWSDHANTTHIEFLLDFNWSYPDEDLSGIRVNVTDGAGNTNTTLFENVFRVENDMALTGSLSAVGGFQGTLSSGDWVRASEFVTFSGVSVCYSGFNGIHPNDQYFNISITNDTGHSWHNATSSGQPFSLTLNASPVSDAENVHTISVNALPPGRPGDEPNDLFFTIKVDGDAPPAPRNLLIHADSYSDNRTHADDDREFFAEWNASSDTGSGTALYYYSYVNDEGSPDNNMSADNRTTIHEATLTEGTHALYVWCEDHVGNIGLAGSDSIIYDASPPVFFGDNEVEIDGGTEMTNSSTLPFIWQNFIDTGATPAGIDHYYYSFQNNGGSDNGFVDYGSPGQLSGAQEDTVNVYVWAVDKAGNSGPAATDSIVVDTVAVFFENPVPSPDQWVNRTTVAFEIDIRDNTSGVVPTTIDYRYYNGTLSGWIDAGYTGAAQQLITASATVEFAAGTENHIEWRAEDNLTNGPSASPKYAVKVDLLSPDNSLASVVIEAGAEHLGTNTIDFEWTNFTDAGGAGIKGYYYNFTNNSGTNKGTYTTETSTTVTSQNWENVTLYVWAVDSAGNIGDAVEDTIYLDNSAPDIGGAWLLINNGDEWTNRTTLSLAWGGFDDPTLDRFYFSFADESGGSDVNTTMERHANIAGAPVRKDVTVYVWARDIYGHYSAAVSDSISIDIVRPTFSGGAKLVIENGSKYTSDPFVHYNITGIVDLGVDQSGILGYYYASSNNSGTGNGVMLDAAIGTIKIANPGDTHIYIWGVDRAGNIQNRVLYTYIIVDIGEPQAGSLTLQNGATYWNSSSVRLNWAGFTDEDYRYRGIAGYYFSTENNEGTTNGQISNGGLRAHYFNGINFDDYKGSRYEATINTRYPNGAPWGCGWNTFSVIWNGSIFCPYHETYTFKIGGDDGVRLYIDDVRLINEWREQPYTEFTASVNLTRGFHRFELRFFENAGGQRVTAKWSSAHINEAIIAAQYLWGGQTYDYLNVPGEGVRNVHIWAQDYCFNIGDSVSDDIFLDFTAPASTGASMSIENRSELCSDKTIYVNWSGFSDRTPSSGIKGYYISYNNGSGSDRGTWIDGTNHTLHASEGNRSVYVWAEDLAGNRGLAVYDTIEVIYPNLLDFSHPNIAFRGKTISITMNLTDVVFGEKGLSIDLRIQKGESHEPWNDMPIEYFDDDEEGYWFSSYEPGLDVPVGTIFNLQLRYTNPGGYISTWRLGAFKATNNFPMINGTATFTAQEDNLITADLRGMGWDREDGDDPELVAWSLEEYDEEIISEVFETGQKGVFVFESRENYHGNSSVTARLTDGDGDFSKQEFTLVWEEVNDAPEVRKGAVTLIHLEEDNDTNYSLDISKIFIDADGDPLTIEFTGVVHLHPDLYGPGKYNVSSEPNWHGVENLTISASDGKKKTFHVITFVVESVNDPPIQIRQLEEMTIDEDGEAYLAMLSYFSDIDDPVLLYQTASSNVNVEAAVMSNNSLRLRPWPDWSGNVNIDISALDPSGEKAEFSFTLVVREINDIPFAFIDQRPREMERGKNMVLSGRGMDVDGTISGYEWTSSVDGFLGNQERMDLLFTENLSLGIHIIELRVKDDDDAWSLPGTMEIFISFPQLHIKVEDPAGKISEGETINIPVHMENTGSAEARNVTVRLLVDGQVVEKLVIFHLLPGDRKILNFTWKARAGKHNITVDVPGTGKNVLISEDSEMASDIEIVEDSSQWTLLFSILATIVAIIFLILLSSQLRKRRRKKVLFRLKGMLGEAKKGGVGADEAKDVLSNTGNEYGIRLK